ncbi:Asp-tRNA(Asn)/Glu-tRNA(Gln) amidotransferase subunit GatB [Thermogemmatispora tikiterensis]|uniref:Aspartyl/glutamyl-tRNA(Asn/Gln) amidotransferase subunit B n=1 Tax=Thermogemmatispora tikiterensis TaxID=1825093 RepID=A0A328VBS4_9CHLR|nr:Asp-tRNA(Asn)/Glu-tRNA(Gln) amidotransferase subunit GatB [Thermogemmatispora tikiterensis]RAQ95138.1 glutaminyl-tRNA synthase (glutamine-hydrolyzing) subunit B [Thermogemmatispora tikiterensis]
MAVPAHTEVATEFEIVIGLEVHAQLTTRSKMFCSCSTDYANAAPNTHVCPVCMGMPGVLPVINRQAVAYTIMTALALNCSIPEYSKFDRKNYPYPDLMKGYQISQYDLPLSRNGYLLIEHDGQVRRIGITRVHLEEDTAKLLHRDGYSLVDVNRAGTPLIEIVSEPDMRSPEEARLYMQKLREILVYLGVSSGRMEEGSLRCDANISVRPRGQQTLGVKTEIKNMNSFKALQQALEYEAHRQIEVLRAGGTIQQETRGWDESRGVTVPQRSKEYAHDYRYFPEPDLPPLVISREWVEELRARLPELPDARRLRYQRDYGLSAQDADILTEEKALGDYFDQVMALSSQVQDRQTRARAASNWLLSEVVRLLHAHDIAPAACPLKPEALVNLLDLLDRQRITGKQAKEVLDEAFVSGELPETIVVRKGIQPPITDPQALERIIVEVIEANPKIVADYRAGKTNAAQYLVGQIMKRTRGQAKADLVQQLLRAKLDETPTA